MKVVLGTLLLVFACAQAATTNNNQHGSHHGSPALPHEQTEHENYNFAYEPHAHQMVMNSLGDTSCYIIDLTDAERVAVHTDSGMRSLELKLLTNLDTATKTEVTRDTVEEHLVHFCNWKATHIYKVTI